MKDTPLLETFWFSFPLDPRFPLGVGVTAYSEADARVLIAESGAGVRLSEAKEVRVKRGVRVEDLEQRHVAQNIGPLQFRGVWYPCLNVGFGTPRATEYRALKE